MDDHIFDRGHLACDLKWRLAATRGIIIFPKMQQLSLHEMSVFSGYLVNSCSATQLGYRCGYSVESAILTLTLYTIVQQRNAS